MIESKLSGEQMAALMAQGFWPIDLVRPLPSTGILVVIEIDGERWASRSPKFSDKQKTKGHEENS